MKFSVKSRLAKGQADDLRRIAKTNNTSVSALIEEALLPFAEGKKTLPRFYAGTSVYTGFSLDEDLTRTIKALADDHNISWDDLVRYAVGGLIEETRNRKTKP